MYVKLVAKTEIVEFIDEYIPHEESPGASSELSEMAGRLCYESWVRPNPSTASNQGYLGNIISHGHLSVLEHGSATFYISGVSRALTHELVRHRHFSFSQVSQRYVDSSNTESVLPDAFSRLSESRRLDVGQYMEQSRRLYLDIYDELTAAGLDRKSARGAARHVLLQSGGTKLFVTGNHRSWREFIDKRNSPAADQEIRDLAQVILTILKREEPNLYQDLEV